MIYTVTLNPAIDLIVNSELHVGELNRAQSEEYVLGGKGILVSEAVKIFGAETTATGFLAGFTGDFLRRELTRKQIPNHFITADGITRVNVKVFSETSDMTQINLTGIRVTPVKFRELTRYLEENLTKEDTLVFSGSTAEGVSLNEFRDLCEIASRCAGKLVLDTSLEYIMASLDFHPWLVRPTVYELYDALSSRRQGYENDMIEQGKKLRRLGAKNVLMRDVRKATILVSEKGVYFGEPAETPVVSTLGTSDAMIAAFILKYEETGDYGKATEWAMAAAAATSASADMPSLKEIEEALKDTGVVFAGGAE